MRVLVLGAAGMLGHKVWQELGFRGLDVAVTTRAEPAAYAAAKLFQEAHAGVLDVRRDSLGPVLDRVRPDAVVNCIGIVKQLREGSLAIPSIEINALLPHRLEKECFERGARLIHISTDCVFDGTRGGYQESDRPDAIDLYGRSKALGEVTGPLSLTLRTSIIGRELTGSSGLLEWFLSQPGPTVPGFSRAWFSGVTTQFLASLIADVLQHHEDLQGLFHVAGERISKLELLRLLAVAYGRDVDVVPNASLVIDRSLDARRFWGRLDRQPPPWPTLVAQLAADPSPYDEWRHALASA